MPRAIWGTPQPASAMGYTPEEPRGILGFLGGGQDIGADIGDRAGIISQILMNLGSGRGGAGIAEATMAANERSAARREDQRNKAMVNRMADKLEPSNPEMAMMMRANTKFGMAMLGKQLEDEWTSKSDMAKLGKEYELRGANEQALETQKAELKRGLMQDRLRAMGFDIGGGDTSVATAPVPAAGDVGGTPSPTGVTGGGGPAPAVTQQPEQVPPPAPAAVDGTDYTVGLTPNPALRGAQLKLRQMYDDPEMPVEDVQLFLDSAQTDTAEGANIARKNIAARKEKRARVQGLQTRASAADAAFQSAQGLPGINMSAPGEAEMRQAGIDPKLRPDLNPAQTAEQMRVAAETGPEQYNSLLGTLAKPRAAAGSIRINPETGQLEVMPDGKETGEMGRNEALALRAEVSMPILDNKANVESLTTGIDPVVDATMPAWLANLKLDPKFKLAKAAGANFLSAILRKESLSAIKEEEFDMYGPFFLPQANDDPTLLAFKSELRQRAYQGMLTNMSPRAQFAYAAQATKAREEALAKGETPPPLPDITKWPTQPDLGGTSPQPAPAPSPIDDLLKKYPPKPAAGP